MLYLKKIKLNLVNKGDIKIYLFYAFGETILIVFGILLALQLNIWNQERINAKTEAQYYHNLKNQLNEDRISLIDEINSNTNYLSQFSYAKLIILSNDKNKIDSLGKIVLELINHSDFRRKSNVYQTLVNSGEIKHIKNQKIIQKLQTLEDTYEFINRLEETHLNFIIYQLTPDIKKIIQIDPLVIKDEESLYSYQFQNDFDLTIGIINRTMERYRQAVGEINSIIESIDQGLIN